MTPERVLEWAVLGGQMLVLAALLFSIVRLARGPSLADRAIALDMVALQLVFLVALEAVRTDDHHLVDVLVGLSLLNFMVLVGLAGFLAGESKKGVG